MPKKTQSYNTNYRKNLAKSRETSVLSQKYAADSKYYDSSAKDYALKSALSTGVGFFNSGVENARSKAFKSSAENAAKKSKYSLEMSKELSKQSRLQSAEAYGTYRKERRAAIRANRKSK